jgi:putative membrane protein insertion efficiency factor
MQKHCQLKTHADYCHIDMFPRLRTANFRQALFLYLCDVSKVITTILSFLLSLPVHFYRYTISPLLKPACRHIPSCSQYMLDALKIHGPFGGFVIGLNRIFRCRPGGTHGFDPVPLFRFRRYKPFSTFKKCNRLK